jgi:hypothetical protein
MFESLQKITIIWIISLLYVTLLSAVELIKPELIHVNKINATTVKIRFTDLAVNESGFKIYNLKTKKLLKSLPKKSGRGYVYATIK